MSVIAALIAVRVLIPLAALAAAPAKLPLLPDYHYAPLNGDASGFYDAVTNLFGAFTGIFIGWIGIASLVLLLSFAAAALILWRSGVRWLAILLPALGLSLALAVLVHDMRPPGSGVIGWPLAWALSLLPLPVLHGELTPDRAFAAGLAVSLLANAATVAATALIGFRATGRRVVGLTAAAVYATWPLWVGIVAGTRASENGQWNVDVGLHLYAEPLSTALVAVSLAVLLAPRLSDTSTAVAGLLLGFATVVKLTNGPVAAALVVILGLCWGARRAAILALGGLVSAPIVAGFWSQGYVDSGRGAGVDLHALYQLRFVSMNARTSSIFNATMLLVLVPLAIVGIFTLSGWFRRAMLVAPIVVTIACYAGYYVTNQHPRFYYVILPPLFALQAAGGALVWDVCRSRALRASAVRGRGT